MGNHCPCHHQLFILASSPGIHMDSHKTLIVVCPQLRSFPRESWNHFWLIVLYLSGLNMMEGILIDWELVVNYLLGIFF